MKGKKLLAGVLSAAMVMGTMAFPVFADDSSTAMTYGEFLQKMQNNDYDCDFEGATIKIETDMFCTDTNHDDSCAYTNYRGKADEAPGRIQGTNAQYQLFDEATNVTIKNAKFVTDKTKGVGLHLTNNNGWQGEIAAGADLNVELQFKNSGNLTIEGCEFDGLNVAPYHTGDTTAVGTVDSFKNNKFSNVYNAYGIQGVYSENVIADGNSFENCNGGIYLEGAKKDVTISNNAFNKMGENATEAKKQTAGCIQLSANVSSGASILIISNTSDGSTPVLRQLSQVTEIIALNNDFGGSSELTRTENSDGAEQTEVSAAVQIGEEYYATLKDALAKAEDGATVKIYGTVAVSNGDIPQKSTFTFTKGDDDAELTFFDGENAEWGNGYYVDGSTLTFNDLTLTWKSDMTGLNNGYQGFIRPEQITFNGCTINDTLYLSRNQTFNGCTFVQTDSEKYNVWTYGAENAAFNNCKFESAGRSVLIYAEGGGVSSVVDVKDCDFTASAAAKGKAAIEVDSSLIPGEYTVRIAGSTATGFGTGSTSGSSLYNVKKYKVVTDDTDNSKSLNTKIELEGEVIIPLSPEKMAEVFGQSVAKVGSKVYTTLKDAVKGANDGDTITLLTDTTVPDDFGGGMINFYGKHGSYVVDCNGYRLNGGITAFNYPTDENLTVTIVNADINTTYRKSETGVMIQFAAVYNAMKGGKTVVKNGTFSSDNIVVCQQGGELEIQDGTYIMRAEDGAVVYTNDGITTIENGTFKGADGVKSVYAIHAEERGTVKVSGGSFVGAVEAIDDGKIEISGGTFDGDFSVEGNGAISISGGTFSTDVSAYCADGFKARFVNGKYVVDEDDSTDTVTLKFVPAGENVYDIVLSGNGAVINRLNVAEFKFDMSNPAVSYEIKAADKLTTLQPDVDKYVFYFDGKDGINGADTATDITIGTVTFDGIGAFTFKAVEGKVTDTTMKDNLVNEFVVGGAEGKGTLVIDDEKSVIKSEITIPTKELTVNVLMNHSVGDNAADYQNMTVAISGGDLAGKVLTYNLGDADNAAITKVTNADKKVISYQVKTKLSENRLYTVAVTGAGYRTARYTVTMNDAKTMNVWNNAMSEDTVVVDKTKAKTNFLAGDIVKDGNVNIYDLSAVVAYFGTDNLVADHKDYAKYDLNRDGVIDMMDISIVLASWGK